MFSEEEISAIKILSKKNISVKKLFDFWIEAQNDGVQAMSMALNKKLLETAGQIKNQTIDIKSDDRAFDRMIKTIKDLQDMKNNLQHNRRGSSNTNTNGDESIPDKIANQKREKII